VLPYGDGLDGPLGRAIPPPNRRVHLGACPGNFAGRALCGFFNKFNNALQIEEEVEATARLAAVAG